MSIQGFLSLVRTGPGVSELIYVYSCFTDKMKIKHGQHVFFLKTTLYIYIYNNSLVSNQHLLPIKACLHIIFFNLFIYVSEVTYMTNLLIKLKCDLD